KVGCDARSARGIEVGEGDGLDVIERQQCPRVKRADAADPDHSDSAPNLGGEAHVSITVKRLWPARSGRALTAYREPGGTRPHPRAGRHLEGRRGRHLHQGALEERLLPVDGLRRTMIMRGNVLVP